MGFDGDLLTDFVKRGYLVRFARGAYCLPSDSLSAQGVATALLRDFPSWHVGGVSALASLGQVGGAQIVRLYGTARCQFPVWAAGFPVTYRRIHQLFDWSGVEGKKLQAETLTRCPGPAEELRTSVPERALLECLYGLCQKDEVEALVPVLRACPLMRTLRVPLFARLMMRCQSVQTKRLFVEVARGSAFAHYLHEFVLKYPDIYWGAHAVSFRAGQSIKKIA